MEIMDNTPDVAAVQEATKAERSRISAITALCDKHNMADTARQLIDSGRSLDEARAAVLDKIGAKVEPVAEKAADIGLTAKEAVSSLSSVQSMHWLILVIAGCKKLLHLNASVLMLLLLKQAKQHKALWCLMMYCAATW
jgi:hypothetical protein